MKDVLLFPAFNNNPAVIAKIQAKICNHGAESEDVEVKKQTKEGHTHTKQNRHIPKHRDPRTDTYNNHLIREILLLEEQMKAKRFSVGCWRSVLTPRNRSQQASKTGSTRRHFGYKSDKAHNSS